MSQTTKQVFMQSSKMSEIRLEPLSIDDSVQLVLFYCLRDLSVDEFQNESNIQSNQLNPIQRRISVDLTQSLDSGFFHDQNNKIKQLLSQNINFIMCQGMPEALMTLAFVLRSSKLNQIQITQIKYSKQ